MKLSQCTATVIVEGTELEPLLLSAAVDQDAVATFFHACGIESDLNEDFNLLSSDGSIEGYVGRESIFKANEYLNLFTDNEILAGGDEFGIEQNKELVRDISSLIEAAEGKASVRVTFAEPN